MKSNLTIKFTTSPESPNNIYNFLKSHPAGVLATTNSTNEPHATVVYFSVDKNFKFTFATKSETQKYENMSRNNKVMLVVFDSRTQTTVQVIGTAQKITDEQEVRKVLSNMLHAAKSSIDKEPPLSKLYAGHYEAFQIIPKKVRMAVFLRPDPGGYDIFETIEFE